MGCLQATETIKMLLGRSSEEICSGRVLVFDAMKMKFSEVGLAKQPDRQQITGLIDYQGFCAGPKVAAKTESPHSSTAVAQTTSAAAAGRTMDEAESNSSDNSESFHTIEPRDCLERLSNGWTPFVLDARLQTENDIVALPFTDIVAPHRTVRVESIPEKGTMVRY
jgi:adenylyltransferase/sulfurtransferase